MKRAARSGEIVCAHHRLFLDFETLQGFCTRAQMLNLQLENGIPRECYFLMFKSFILVFAAMKNEKECCQSMKTKRTPPLQFKEPLTDQTKKSS